MAKLKKYQRVKVVKLLESNDFYDGWGFNQRPPQVGDIGYLVDVLTVAELPDRYLIEASEPNGTTLWLSDFLAEELELVEESP